MPADDQEQSIEERGTKDISRANRHPTLGDLRPSTLARFIREPLVHFVVLGALLFGIHEWTGNGASDGGPPDQIIVAQRHIEQLVMGFTRTWRRAPTQEELKGLIDDHIREEISYREAVAMGLDRDDTIVRRRMRQKLEFLTEDLASRTDAPSDQELKDYLAKNADAYREAPRLSFEHLYFSRDRRGRSAKKDAAAVLAQLNGKQGGALDLDTFGDATLLPTDFRLASQAEIGLLFGENFAKQLLEVTMGGWAGPVESTYGLHLVRISERSPGNVPELAKVRDAVLRDFEADRRTQALETAYAKLRQRYSVTVEKTALRVAEAP